MSDEMVSADEARTMLERARHGASVMRDHARATGDEDRAEEYRTHAEDLDAAATLARTVIALHAIIEGRATPPTDAELAAHAERGALWMVAHERGDIFATMMSWPSSRDWHVYKGATRWWPFTIDGRPCAWPTAPQRPAGCICDFRGGLHRFSCARQQPTVAVTRDENGSFRVAGTEVDRGE